MYVKMVCGELISTHHCRIFVDFFAIQRYSMKNYNAKIIAKKIVCGIPNPCYDGLWSDLKRSAPMLQP
jgi:hypothetical protein